MSDPTRLARPRANAVRCRPRRIRPDADLLASILDHISALESRVATIEAGESARQSEYDTTRIFMRRAFEEMLEASNAEVRHASDMVVRELDNTRSKIIEKVAAMLAGRNRPTPSCN
jgi:hypothetical protein